MARSRQTALALACASLLALLGLAAVTIATPGGVPPGPWSSWSTLRLKAHSIPFLTGSVEMSLATVDGARVLETRTEARFFGARVAQTRTASVLDPVTGLPRSYRSVTKRHGRRYTFGERGYVVEKLDPKGRRDDPPDTWSVTSRDEFPYPLADDGQPLPVFDYYGMILHLGALPLDAPGDEALLHVATSDGVKSYRVVVGETQTRPWTFEDLRRGAKRKVELRTLRLRIVPENPGEDGEGFLKMEGETELWVEAGSKTLILLSGDVPKIPGRVRLVLDEIG